MEWTVVTAWNRGSYAAIIQYSCVSLVTACNIAKMFLVCLGNITNSFEATRLRLS